MKMWNALVLNVVFFGSSVKAILTCTSDTDALVDWCASRDLNQTSVPVTLQIASKMLEGEQKANVFSKLETEFLVKTQLASFYGSVSTDSSKDDDEITFIKCRIGKSPASVSMVDKGYNYARLERQLAELGKDPIKFQNIDLKEQIIEGMRKRAGGYGDVAQVKVKMSDYFSLTNFVIRSAVDNKRIMFSFAAGKISGVWEMLKAMTISSMRFEDLNPKHTVTPEAAAVIRASLIAAYIGECNFAFLPAIVSHLMYSTTNFYGHVESGKKNPPYDGHGCIQLWTYPNYMKLHNIHQNFPAIAALRVYANPRILDHFDVFTCTAQINYLIDGSRDFTNITDFMKFTSPKDCKDGKMSELYGNLYFLAMQRFLESLQFAANVMGITVGKKNQRTIKLDAFSKILEIE